MVDDIHCRDGWLGNCIVGISTLDRIIIGEGTHMEAVKWNLENVNKITIYTDSKEIVYKREGESWNGAGISVGTETMKLLMAKYEKAGCVVVPETSIYIPTDTHAIEVGTWEVREGSENWEFDRDYIVVRAGQGWRIQSISSNVTNVTLLGYLRRKLRDGKVVKFLNENLDCIGYID